DKYSAQTYLTNFGEVVAGDIRQIDAATIPEHDILCAGFPCQPFSIAGVSKKNALGRKHGFEDEKQGNLFFEIIRIAKYKRPKVLLLENVKNLKSHDNGNTWRTIQRLLQVNDYEVFSDIIDAKYYVPQHRERVFIVAFEKSQFQGIDFKFPAPPAKRLYELPQIVEPFISESYTLTDKLWSYLFQRKIIQESKGNGFGYGLVNLASDEYTRTLSARYYKDGSEILIAQPPKNPRRLTPRECARLQGFPEDFKIIVSDTQAYRQFGNSVVVPVVTAIYARLLQTLAAYQCGAARKEQLSLF
ncbi:MAG: DNA (cytosine-5-)-methyltransferase, partial [Thiotrichaceae bacterium]